MKSAKSCRSRWSLPNLHEDPETTVAIRPLKQDDRALADRVLADRVLADRVLADRVLADRVLSFAKERGLPGVRWLTRDSDAAARKLYDTYAPRTEFILYDVPR